ncbi:MAG: lactonase family protein [Clostridiales bacterium]|nr:lactonase family protein [Clostridiales bacterium]
MGNKKLMCYVGLNPVGGAPKGGGLAQTEKPKGGGIAIYEMGDDGYSMKHVGGVEKPGKAGALCYAPKAGVLYAVDEKKTGGRGEADNGSSVWAYRVDQKDGGLSFLNKQPAMGPNPTSITVLEDKKALYCAHHGGFDHVEKVVQTADGKWGVRYEYDDASVAQYALNDDGSVGEVVDVAVHAGHGPDPNASPQHGGHAQQSSHAHCTTVDPSGKFLVVGDKGTDRVYVYRIGEKLETAFIYQFEEYTGARHAAFDPNTGRMFLTLEFSSELASFDFNSETGELTLLDRASTIDGFEGRNEPATLQVHPGGRFVYVNNRGEDTIVTMEVSPDGRLKRLAEAKVSQSVDPGIASRWIMLSPSAEYLFVADRPAYVIRAYAVNAEDGSLEAVSEVPVDNPVFILFVEL